MQEYGHGQLRIQLREDENGKKINTRIYSKYLLLRSNTTDLL